jgi:hypothetical protein
MKKHCIAIKAESKSNETCCLRSEIYFWKFTLKRVTNRIKSIWKVNERISSIKIWILINLIVNKFSLATSDLCALLSHNHKIYSIIREIANCYIFTRKIHTII